MLNKVEILIRRYLNGDSKSLLALLNQTYDSCITQQILEDKYLTDTRSIIVAVTEENKLVGCAFTEIQEDYVRPGRIIYVTYVAVENEYRKHGIGKKMMNHVETICIENGCSSIELTSANFRTGAHAFYESIGFTKKKTTVFIKEVNSTPQSK